MIRALTNHVPQPLGHGPAPSGGGGSAEPGQFVGRQAHMESLSPGHRAHLPLQYSGMKRRCRCAAPVHARAVHARPGFGLPQLVGRPERQAPRGEVDASSRQQASWAPGDPLPVRSVPQRRAAAAASQAQANGLPSPGDCQAAAGNTPRRRCRQAPRLFATALEPPQGREPNGGAGTPERVGDAQNQEVGPLDRRCRPAAAAHTAGSQGRAIRQTGGGDPPMAAHEPDGLNLRTARRQNRAVDAELAVPELRSDARARQQRRPDHPRRGIPMGSVEGSSAGHGGEAVKPFRPPRWPGSASPPRSRW